VKATEVDSSTITLTPSTNGLAVNLQYHKGTAVLAAFFPFTGHGMFSDLISGNLEVNQSYDLHMKSVLQILGNRKEGCYLQFPTEKGASVIFQHVYLKSVIEVLQIHCDETTYINPFPEVAGQSGNRIGAMLRPFEYNEVLYAKFTKKFELDPASNVVYSSETQKPSLCIKASCRSCTVTFSTKSGSGVLGWQQIYDIKPYANALETKTDQEPVAEYTFKFSPIIGNMILSQLSAMSKCGFVPEMMLYQKNEENVLLGLQWHTGVDDDNPSKDYKRGFLIGVYGASEDGP
jgi:hypothetical protein